MRLLLVPLLLLVGCDSLRASASAYCNNLHDCRYELYTTYGSGAQCVQERLDYLDPADCRSEHCTLDEAALDACTTDIKKTGCFDWQAAVDACTIATVWTDCDEDAVQACIAVAGEGEPTDDATDTE